MNAPALSCVALTPAREADYLDFFDTRAFPDNPKWAGCYCRFPVHDPTVVSWATQTPAQNREAIRGCIARGTTAGFLAYEGDEVVGWCHAGPWRLIPMLADVPEPEADRLGVIFCFVVAPPARGRGVARALLDAACEGLRAQGLAAVQAKPLKEAATPAAAHLGPLPMYLAAGFSVVREMDDGSVLVRKALA